MKKSILLISLMTVAMAVFAIDYPTYKPTTRSYGSSSRTDNNNSTIGGYSTTTSGGVTTYGEGSAIVPRGPKRTPTGDGTEIGDEITDADGTWQWNGTTWIKVSQDNTETNPGENPEPVGSPLVMLLFAAMAAVVVFLRKHKNLVTE